MRRIQESYRQATTNAADRSRQRELTTSHIPIPLHPPTPRFHTRGRREERRRARFRPTTSDVSALSSPVASRSNGMSSRSCSVRLMLRPARSACPALIRTFTSELSQAGSPHRPASDITSWLIVCCHGRIFPGRTDSLMGCNGVWTFSAATVGPWSQSSSRPLLFARPGVAPT